MSVLPVPAAQLDPVHHADWIELEALQSNDGACSLQTFASQIRISGTTDALTDPDEIDPGDAGGEQSLTVASDAWSEIERRFEACGGNAGGYPFEVTAASILLRNGYETSAYVFQMLLAKFGFDAIPAMHGDRIFERLSGIAALSYFGGEANVAQFRCFGFPRSERTGFSTALEQLCGALNAGRVRTDDPIIKQQKDSHLDIVVWRPFADRRESQLIGFGQCATGKGWNETKLTELQPRNFIDKWLYEGFHPEPIRMYFVPRCIESNGWRHAAISGGILFDRCRISELAREGDGQLVDWSLAALKRLRSDL